MLFFRQNARKIRQISHKKCCILLIGLNIPILSRTCPRKNVNQLKIISLVNRPIEPFYHINKKHKAFIKSGGYLLDRFEWHKLFLDIVEVRNNALNISGSFSVKFYPDTIDIQAIIKTPEGKKEIFDCKKVEYPTTERKTKKYC